MNNPKNLHAVYFGLGSNIGDKLKNIEIAIDHINHKIGKIDKISAMYKTAPVGFKSDNIFVNAACLLQTHLSPNEVLNQTQLIEKEMGRTIKSINGIHTDRTIDIDILLFDQLTIEEENLRIPHPQLHKREFVLLPMNDIAPNLSHPILGDTMKDLLNKISK